MPGVVMENGIRTGAHTNHDRDSMANGINGVGHLKDYNGHGTLKTHNHQSPAKPGAQGLGKDIHDLATQAPPGIPHIDHGLLELKTVLARLAQSTHNDLMTVVEELAAFGTPPSTGGVDDNSQHNIAKKVKLLKWLEQQHENFTKALVITNWSRSSQEVGKIIDLKTWLDGEKFHYDMAFHEMSEMKRSLTHARVPGPDFNTALEVLSTGSASWVPDLGYIEPSPLTGQELLASLRNLNTLLHERLHLHDYEKIPHYFRNFTIKNGRVTFRVEHEFEVDLTIADEDPEKQFWFINFRFLFNPSVSDFKEYLRFALEDQVNAAIEKDGLAGCYRVLHELTLTHKLAELRRQAQELSRGRWSSTLLVEPLHRGVSIQYWLDRYGEKGPKSWIMLVPHSGRKADDTSDEKTTSRIDIRWFRDGKEVKDAKLSIDTAALNVEAFLRSVIGLHVKHILLRIRTALRSKPLFKSEELKVSLKRSRIGNGEPELQVQLTKDCTIKVLIDHVTGRFAISPSTRISSQAEAILNSQMLNPESDGHESIEKLRSVLLCEETVAKANTVGWTPIGNRIPQDELKPIMPRDTLQLSWFKRPHWRPNWYLALSSGMSGERWWLIAVSDVPKEDATGIAALDRPKVAYHMQIQTGEMCLQPTYELLRNLEVRASAMICFYTNAKELHDTKVPFAFNSLPRRRARTLESTATFQMPELYVSTQALLAVAGKSPSERISWTKQSLEISFTGLEKALQSAHIPSGKLVNDKRRLTTDITSPPSTQSSLPQLSQPSALKLPLTPVQSLSQQGSATPAASEAIFTARGHLNSLMPSSLLSKPVDNVSFHPDSGGFAFRLASRVGDGVIKPATDQLRRVERLVDFVNVVQRYPDAVAADSVGLQKVVFSYWCAPLSQTQMLDLTKEQATIEFPAASSTEQKPTTVLPPKLDLTDGNPHIRVKDFLSDILSSPAGLEGLVRCLLLTLPIVRGLDQAEDSWSKLCASTRNEFYILPRTAEWYSLRYAFDLGERGTVRLHLDLTCRNRNGESWWWIKKYNPKRERVNLTPAQLAVDNVLRQKFWEAPGAELWETEIGGAYAKPGAAEMMLLAVDEVLRQIALDPSSLVIDETPVPGDRADSGASGAAKQEQATSAQLQAKAAAMQLNLPPPVKARQAQAKPVPRRPSATTAQSSPKQGMSQPLSGQQGAPVAQMHVGQHQPQQQAGMVRQPSSQGQQPGQQRKSISPAMQKKHQAAMVQAQQQQQQQRMAAQMAQMQGRPMNQQQQAMMQLQLQQQQQQLQARQRSSQGGANKDEPVILD